MLKNSITTGITNNIFRTLIAIMVLSTASYWVGAREGKVLQLWCVQENNTALYPNTNFCNFFSENSNLPSCVEMGRNHTLQRTRICGTEDQEMMVRYLIAGLLLVSFSVSLLATLMLNSLSSWETMMDASGSCLCIPTSPFIHRSVLLSKMQEVPGRFFLVLEDPAGEWNKPGTPCQQGG